MPIKHTATTTHMKSKMFGIIPACCGTHSGMIAHHTHLHTCQSLSHHRTSLSCVAGLCWGGVDSEGCFINPARVHLHLPRCFGMKGSDDPGIFFSFFFSAPSAPSSSPYHLDNVAFCPGGYRGWQRALGHMSKKRPGRSLWDLAASKQNPLSVALRGAREEVLEGGRG